MKKKLLKFILGKDGKMLIELYNKNVMSVFSIQGFILKYTGGIRIADVTSIKVAIELYFELKKLSKKYSESWYDDGDNENYMW